MRALLLHPGEQERQRFAGLLGAEGFEVSAFEDGPGAAAAVSQDNVRLIVAGGPDAVRFVSDLRERHGQGHLPVLGIGRDREAEALLLAGADEVVGASAPAALIAHRLRRVVCAEVSAPGAATVPNARLLQEIARANAELLTGDDVHAAIEGALGIIGAAVDVDRAYLFQNHPHPVSGELAMSQRVEWARLPEMAEIDNADIKDLLYHERGLGHWLPAFWAGEPVQGVVRELTAAERAILEPQGILSFIVLPIHVHDEFWGFIGLDDCRTERRWSAAEEAALRLTAVGIGRALERQRAMEALQRSEERYRSLVEQTSDVVYRHDLEGRYTEVNEAGASLLGYTAEEFCQLSYEDVVHPDSKPHVDDRLNHKLAGETPSTRYELDVRRKDGSVLRMESNTRVVYEGGEPVAVEGVARDITARKLTQERLNQKLHESEALYAFSERVRMAASVQEVCEAAVETLVAVCGTTRASVRLVGESPEQLLFAASTGVSAEYRAAVEPLERRPVEVRTSGPYVLQDIAEFCDLASLQQPMLNEGIRSLVGVPMISSDTGEEVGRCTAYYAEPDQGTPERVRLAETVASTAALAINRIRATESVQASESRFRTMFEAAPEAVAIIRLCDGVIVDVNRRFYDFAGYPAEEFIGKYWRDIALFPSAELMQELSEAVRSNPGGLTREVPYQHQNGELRECMLDIATIELGGDACAMAIARDITERKQQERERARLAAIVESTDAAVITCDPDGFIRSANAATRTVYGYSPEELIGQHIRVMIPPDMRDETRAFHQAVETDKPMTTETVRLAADGRRVDVTVSLFPVYDEDGTVISYASIARDITERKRQEADLARLAAIFESADAATLAYSPDATIVAANRAAERLYGYGVEELVGAPLELLIPEEQQEQARGVFYEVLHDGRVDTFERERVRADGSRVEVMLSVFPVRDPQGTIIGVASSAHDVTEKKQQQRQLARLAAIVESSDDAIYVSNPVSGQPLVWNRAAEQLFGYSKDEIARHGVWHIVPDDDLELTQAIARKSLAGELVPARQTVRLDKHGNRIDVSLSVFPVWGEDGELVGGGAIARDIRAQKAAEAALQEARERLRVIAQNSPLALFEVDAEGIITFYEGRGLGRAGFDSAKLVGRPVSETARDNPDVVENARRALSGEAFASIAWIGPHAYETHHTPTRDAEGNVTGFFGVTLDITDRMRAEQARRDAEALVANVTGNMPVVLLAIDANGHFVFLDGQPLESIGISRDAFIGRHFTELAPRAANALGTWERAMAGEVVHTQLRLNGRHFELAFNPWRDANGDIAGIIGAALDITERKEAERARRLAEQRLQQVAAAAPVLLFSLDPAGMVTFADGALARRIRQLTGRSFDASLLEIYADFPEVSEPIRRSLAGEASTSRISFRDLTLEMRLTPVRDADGRVSDVVGIILDISDRAHAEEALRQAQKLESLAVLAGGIAHDFNNLLVGILGNAGLALAELKEDSPARETLEDIETAGRRAAELARQMLAYSGRGRLVMQPIDLSAVVREMHQLLRAYTHSAVTHFELADDLPAVEADATQIRQVVMNLVINAADAIEEQDGVISVRTGLMYASEDYLASTYLPEGQQPGDYVYLDVADTGKGMTPETLERIFDPFFTTKFTGKGLGLAAVLGIVRGHRGAIKVESTPGEGTTFRLLLPVSEAAPTVEPTAGAPSEYWRGSGLILLVDDEEPVRMVAARALRSFGFEVVTAADGAEAEEHFAREPQAFVAALLDVTMPRMGGHALMERLHELRSDVPIVLMSGYHEHESIDSTAEKGRVAFVQKPFSLGALREALREVIEAAG